MKYELSDGYRLVFQRLPGRDKYLALTVGKHDHVDSFFDGHKGWVFSESGNLRELRLATIEETIVEIVPSSAVEPDHVARPVQHHSRVLEHFTDEMLDRLEVPSEFFAPLRNVEDANSLTFMQLLDELNSRSTSAADLVLSYATGNSETQESIVSIARGTSLFAKTIPNDMVDNVVKSSEEFISFDDPADLKEVLKRETFEQWQLFLHPAQKSLVERRMQGPARALLRPSCQIR